MPTCLSNRSLRPTPRKTRDGRPVSRAAPTLIGLKFVGPVHVVFAGDDPAIAHQLPGSRKPTELADFGDHRRGGNLRDASQGLVPLNDCANRRGGARNRVVNCLLQALETRGAALH